MEHDALEAGVYGGLTTKDSIKLLICYIIRNLGTPIPRDTFCGEMYSDGIANYFELQEAFADLERKQLIFELPNKKDYYDATEKGLETVHELKKMIPEHVRERAFFVAEKMMRRIHYQEQTQVEDKKLENGGYLVTCKITEGEKVMMSASLNVPDFDTMQRVKNIFWDSPEAVYAGMIQLLTHEQIDFKGVEPKFLDK